mgnify:CR=1 FL=1
MLFVLKNNLASKLMHHCKGVRVKVAIYMHYLFIVESGLERDFNIKGLFLSILKELILIRHNYTADCTMEGSANVEKG